MENTTFFLNTYPEEEEEEALVALYSLWSNKTTTLSIYAHYSHHIPSPIRFKQPASDLSRCCCYFARQ